MPSVAYPIKHVAISVVPHTQLALSGILEWLMSRLGVSATICGLLISWLEAVCWSFPTLMHVSVVPLTHASVDWFYATWLYYMLFASMYPPFFGVDEVTGSFDGAIDTLDMKYGVPFSIPLGMEMKNTLLEQPQEILTRFLKRVLQSNITTSGLDSLRPPWPPLLWRTYLQLIKPSIGLYEPGNKITAPTLCTY